MRRYRGHQGKCPRLMFFSQLFSGRLSPLNLSRSSTFAAAKAPEDNLGSSEEGGDVQRNLQRCILRTRGPHCCRVTPMNEESSTSVSGFSVSQESCTTRDRNQTSDGATAARAQILMCRLGSSRMYFVHSPSSLSPEKLTGSESVIDVPMNTAKI